MSDLMWCRRCEAIVDTEADYERLRCWDCGSYAVHEIEEHEDAHERGSEAA